MDSEYTEDAREGGRCCDERGPGTGTAEHSHNSCSRSPRPLTNALCACVTSFMIIQPDEASPPASGLASSPDAVAPRGGTPLSASASAVPSVVAMPSPSPPPAACGGGCASAAGAAAALPAGAFAAAAVAVAAAPVGGGGLR